MLFLFQRRQNSQGHGSNRICLKILRDYLQSTVEEAANQGGGVTQWLWRDRGGRSGEPPREVLLVDGCSHCQNCAPNRPGVGKQCPNYVLLPSHLLHMLRFVHNQPEAWVMQSIRGQWQCSQEQGGEGWKGALGSKCEITGIMDVFFCSLRLLARTKACVFLGHLPVSNHWRNSAGRELSGAETHPAPVRWVLHATLFSVSPLHAKLHLSIASSPPFQAPGERQALP